MIDSPIISSAEYPKVRSAPLFQLMTMLWRSLLTMASSEESTIAVKSSSVEIKAGLSVTCYALIGLERARGCPRRSGSEIYDFTKIDRSPLG